MSWQLRLEVPCEGETWSLQAANLAVLGHPGKRNPAGHAAGSLRGSLETVCMAPGQGRVPLRGGFAEGCAVTLLWLALQAWGPFPPFPEESPPPPSGMEDFFWLMMVMMIALLIPSAPRLLGELWEELRSGPVRRFDASWEAVKDAQREFSTRVDATEWLVRYYQRRGRATVARWERKRPWEREPGLFRELPEEERRAEKAALEGDLAEYLDYLLRLMGEDFLPADAVKGLRERLDRKRGRP